MKEKGMTHARLALVALLLAQAVPGWSGMMNPLVGLGGGEPRIRWGSLGLRPYYSISGTYDDNIYLVPPDKNNHAVAGGGVRGSMIMTNNAGLGVDLPFSERHRLSALYDFVSQKYEAQPKANDSINQKVEGLYEFKGSRLGFSAYDKYMNTQDPQFNPNHATVAGTLVERQRRWQNTGGAVVEHGLGDMYFVGLDAEHTVHKYLEPSLAYTLNRYETTFGGRFGYKIQPRTKVFLAGHRLLTHYTAGPTVNAVTGQTHVANHQDWLFDGGIEGELTAKTKIMLQTGLQYREYDQDNADARRNPVTRNWQGRMTLDYRPTERCSFALSFLRALNEAVTGGNFYISSGASLQAAHKWNKLSFILNGGWQVDKYSETITLGGHTANRRDDLYSAGAKVGYNILDWVAFESGYEHRRRHSIFTEQFNYKDNRTSAGLKFVF